MLITADVDTARHRYGPLRDLRGKVAFITGGSSGIGLGIARACAAAGMKVAITYRTEEHLAIARSALERENANVCAIPLDVTDKDMMLRATDEAESTLGSVDLLCSNAGVGITTRIREATIGDWSFALNVNVWGTINAIHALLPRMLSRGSPAHIVATASMSGIFHGGEAGVYTTTKFAIVGMMEALRAELSSGPIGVSVFCPGLVQSNIFDSNRNRPTSPDDGHRHDARETQHAARLANLMRAGMDPLECGRRVIEGVQRNDMYILTHPEYKQGLIDRFEALIASFPKDVTAPAERASAEAKVLRHEIYFAENARLSAVGN